MIEGRFARRFLSQQQVLSPDHAQTTPGKKILTKALLGEDFTEHGKRSIGDCRSLAEEKPALKVGGGRLKGPLTYQSKEHKGSKGHKDRKDEQGDKEYIDRIKTVEDLETKSPEESEAMYEGGGNKIRRGPNGDTLLQWGQRKRPRYREQTGPLKTSIRVDRRVVRADKQIAALPTTQSRGNILRPSNATMPEAAFGTGRRMSEETDCSGTPAPICNHDHGLLSTGNLASSGDKDQQSSNPEKAPYGTIAGNVLATVFALRQVDNESLEKSVAMEKMNMELFEWPKIVISLTRKEKEDDFSAIKGTKLPQRPKRRLKTVEKNVQFISPGAWLCDLTRERYEVREKKAVKKKPRGLKAMGSVDSDSQ